MVNDKDYRLGAENFVVGNYDKTQIMLVDTHRKGMKHYDEWLAKNAFGYHKTTPYTIDTKGNIFEHYEPSNAAKIFNIEEIDNKIIPISLVNLGWVEANTKKNTFINWCGDIYVSDEDVHVCNWRNHLFWGKYSDSQVESLINLISKLCKDFDIEQKVKGDNTYDPYASNFMGVTYKSNYSSMCTDINPSMGFENLKNKIEI